jgi:predicted negative regulator of RcsB-dependent stress response
VDEYLSEREQVDRIRQWWKENGGWIIVGIGAGVMALVMWNWWQGWKLERAEQASAIYSTLAAAAAEERVDEVRVGVERLAADYGSSPYLQQGRLLLAALLANTGESEAAAAELESVLGKAKDPQLALVARLRLARLLADDGKDERALQLVEEGQAGAFSAPLLEIRGDILAARGDFDGAREAYRQALEDAALAGGVIDEEFVRLKLDALAESPAVGSDAS